MASPTYNGFAPNMAGLFAAIDVYIEDERRNGRLHWIDETGWSSRFATLVFEPETCRAALRAIGRIIHIAADQDCQHLVTFLFDTLANAIRIDGRWRVLFGKYYILDQSISTIGTIHRSGRPDSEVLLRTGVRLLANCLCDPEVDGFANRARIVANLPFTLIENMMYSSSQRMEVVALAYNIGVYDEGFRNRLLSSAGLARTLWKILEDYSRPGSDPLPLLIQICEMLIWAPKGIFLTIVRDVCLYFKPADDFIRKETFTILLGLSQNSPWWEDVESLNELALSVLSVHGLPVEEKSFVDLLEFVRSTCYLEVPVTRSIASSTESLDERFLGREKESLEISRGTLIQELSRLAANPHEALGWPATSQPFQILLAWIEASNFQLRICALNMIANFAHQSEVLVRSLMKDKSLPEKLAIVTRNELNALVLSAALGTVSRLARTTRERSMFGKAGLLDGISPKWLQGTNSPLQMEALTTTRHLLSGTLENIKRFMNKQSPGKRSLLLILFHRFEQSSVTEARLAIAWVMERLWRSIYVAPAARPIYDEETDMASYDAILRTLLFETIPNLYYSCPKILQPFLVLLEYGDLEQRNGASYTLNIMLKEQRDYNAVWSTLCEGEGQEILATVIKNVRDPAPRNNALNMVRKLRAHYADYPKYASFLDGLLEM